MYPDSGTGDWKLVVHTEDATCYVSDNDCLQNDEDQQAINHKLAELYYRSLTQTHKEDNKK